MTGTLLGSEMVDRNRAQLLVQRALLSSVRRLRLMRAILVPIKAFEQAKHRLSRVLSDEQRRALAKDLASLVLGATGSCPVYVVCDDGEVADWAVESGAYVLWTPGLGLSGAVNAGVDYLARRSVSLVVVAHADLPFVESLDRFGNEGEITLAPDRRLDGTNVAAIPTSSGFAFSYGPGSFQRHRSLAKLLGIHCEVIHDWDFAADIDTASDLALVREVIKSPSGNSRASSRIGWLNDTTPSVAGKVRSRLDTFR